MKTKLTLFIIFGLLIFPVIGFSQLASNIDFEFDSDLTLEIPRNDTSAETISTAKVQTNTFAETNTDARLVESILNSEMSLSVVFFDYNSTDLTISTIYELNRLTRLLEKHPDMVLEIVGHTDNYGSNTYNADLSEKRTSAIVYYFKNQADINEKRLIIKNLGESKPIAGNQTEDSRRLNRRVEMKLKIR
jgi:outer membrane protein OmpA-like peptidoglycan-associated protein